MKKVRLDIDTIPDTLYYALLNEFKKQGGNGEYGEWNITAEKSEYDICPICKSEYSLNDGHRCNRI